MIDWTALRIGWIKRRNRVFANPRFQYWAARLPLIRWIARSRADAAFDLLAGFAYSQVLRAYVEGGLFDILQDGPLSLGEIVARVDRPVDDVAVSLGRLSAHGWVVDHAGWWESVRVTPTLDRVGR